MSTITFNLSFIFTFSFTFHFHFLLSLHFSLFTIQNSVSQPAWRLSTENEYYEQLERGRWAAGALRELALLSTSNRLGGARRSQQAVGTRRHPSCWLPTLKQLLPPQKKWRKSQESHSASKKVDVMHVKTVLLIVILKVIISTPTITKFFNPWNFQHFFTSRAL